MAKDKIPPGVSGWSIGHGPNRGRKGKKGCGKSAAMILAVLAGGTSAAVWLGWRLVEALTS